MKHFKDFGLLPSIIKSLNEKKFFKATEIQSLTIPLLMSGQSVVGISETGSGKTLAYALPILHLLKTLEDDGYPVDKESTPRAVILVPTRELGEQVAKVFKMLTHDTRLRVRTALGGMSLAQARKNTESPFEILLATPGRLGQMLQGEHIDLSEVLALVYDEADQMMDQGFLADTNYIASQCPEDAQRILFSATVSDKVQELINEMFEDAEFCKSSGSGKTVSTLTTKNIMVKDGKRWPELEKVLSKGVEGGTILFTNTREQCDALAKELTERGYENLIYRGEMEKTDRRQNLKKFRDGKVGLLVATDLAGRGLDIESVGRVINYHLPKQMDNYVHRAGRTARAGRPGLVVNLVTERDERLIAQLEGRKPKDLGTLMKENRPKKQERSKASSASDSAKKTFTKSSPKKFDGNKKTNKAVKAKKK